MKYALKSVPGLADIGVPHGVGDGLVRLHPDGQSNLEKVENNPLNYLKQLGIYQYLCKNKLLQYAEPLLSDLSLQRAMVNL